VDSLNSHENIVVVGLGYIGLPLAVLLSTKFNVTGFDIDSKLVLEFRKEQNSTNEVAKIHQVLER